MAEISSGSKTVFRQSTALVGWTKITTHNDCLLRIVSGTASFGGSTAASSIFTSYSVSGSVSLATSPSTVGDTTLSSTQIPAHSHTAYFTNVTAPAVRKLGAGNNTISSPLATFQTDPAGGGGTHTHSLSVSMSSPGFSSSDTKNFSVKYIDVILASRD